MIRYLASAALTSLLSAMTPPAYSATTVTGVPNFHQVTNHIFRGGQPDARGWPELARLGVKKVIDLRRPGEHSTTAESLAVVSAGMLYVNFPMDGFATPTSEQMNVPVALMDGGEPVFIHCKRGCERTGTVVAAYRISRQGWENDHALAEANRNGLAWWARGMRRFIAGYHPAAEATVATARLDEVPAIGADSLRTEVAR
jgi:protein tyrosine phosphatase (PTP) superfamily phosphohydrolase (DUF442 family)